MGVEKTIIMKQFNGTDYDILYPKTTADQIENVYTENQILSSGTTGKYQLPAGSLPDAVFNKLLEAMPWTLIQEYKTAGAYTWTAPDLYNGASYKIGVYMVGGGGSGAAGDTTGTEVQGVTGGAAGYGKNIILNITPGQQFNAVVGAGGKAVTFTGNYESSPIYVAGNTGGTTSFNNKTALGGGGGMFNIGASGGQGSDGITASAESPYYTVVGKDLYAGVKADITIGNLPATRIPYPQGASQPPRASQNWFDPTMVTLCAGGWAGYNNVEIINAMPDGTKGGNGGRPNSDASMLSATGNGNGGGANSASRSSVVQTFSSGAGSDGMILIYAKVV